MARSPGFGSNATNSRRPVQTRFRYAFASRLKLARNTNSLTHYTKGTQSPIKRRAPTDCRHSVSGTVSLPSSGCFSPFPHGTCSLSVTEEYLGLEGGPPTFRQGFTCPALLEDPKRTVPVRGYHPLWPAFPDRSGCSLQATGLVRVRSPLLTESRLMSFPPATEMFQFAGFASHGYGFTMRYRPKAVGCPIRRFPDQSLLAAPRNFSQPVTSFIASQCQGIHQMPLRRLILNPHAGINGTAITIVNNRRQND